MLKMIKWMSIILWLCFISWLELSRLRMDSRAAVTSPEFARP